VREASQLFSDDLLQDVSIERQIGDQLLQLAVFVAQRPQLADLLDPDPAADLADFLAALDLVQRGNDLFVLAAFAWPRVRLLAGRGRPL
jgi:hypothetical protein